VLHVVPAENGIPARWSGAGTVLHQELCLAIREVLIHTGEDAWWSKRARDRMQQEREKHVFLAEESLPLVREPDGLRLWTFGGARVNLLLARVLASLLGDRVTMSNLSIGLKEGAAQSEVAVRDALARLRSEGRPQREDAIRFAAPQRGMRLSKFEPCLPPRLEALYYASTLTDAAGARKALALPTS
jgi:hypothetical protein